MVFEETITIECFLGGLTIAINGFTMVFDIAYCYHRFQWFSMVLDHWSNDAMVSMDRCGLYRIHISIYKDLDKSLKSSPINKDTAKQMVKSMKKLGHFAAQSP